jgi:multidrug efflux pump subunit AcrB
MRKFPGVRLDIGGEAEESRQAIIDIVLSFAMAAVGIYFLLMILFESVTQPFIVLMTVPCGVMGVIFALMLHGMSQVSFFAAIGVVGLAGVVVNDALVMVAHLNTLRREYKGRDMTAIIAEGAANRLRPVLLTTITTVFGLLPLTYGIGGYDETMAPMAMAMGYGLLFATPVTLILLPSLYLIRSDIEMALSRLFRRQKTEQFEIERHLVHDVPDGLVMEE